MDINVENDKTHWFHNKNFKYYFMYSLPYIFIIQVINNFYSTIYQKTKNINKISYSALQAISKNFKFIYIKQREVILMSN